MRLTTTTAINLITGSMLGLLLLAAVVAHQGVSLVYLSTETPAQSAGGGAASVDVRRPAIYSPTGPVPALNAGLPLAAGPVGGKQPGAVRHAARGAVSASPAPGSTKTAAEVARPSADGAEVAGQTARGGGRLDHTAPASTGLVGEGGPGRRNPRT